MPELRESIHNDTKHDVQPNSGNNDEERDVIEQPQPSHLPLIWDQWNYLEGEQLYNEILPYKWLHTLG